MQCFTKAWQYKLVMQVGVIRLRYKWAVRKISLRYDRVGISNNKALTAISAHHLALPFKLDV